MSSGFEVQQIILDKNTLKKLKAQDEEIFTIQVGLFDHWYSRSFIKKWTGVFAVISKYSFFVWLG